MVCCARAVKGDTATKRKKKRIVRPATFRIAIPTGHQTMALLSSSERLCGFIENSTPRIPIPLRTAGA